MQLKRSVGHIESLQARKWLLCKWTHSRSSTSSMMLFSLLPSCQPASGWVGPISRTCHACSVDRLTNWHTPSGYVIQCRASIDRPAANPTAQLLVYVLRSWHKDRFQARYQRLPRGVRHQSRSTTFENAHILVIAPPPHPYASGKRHRHSKRTLVRPKELSDH